MPKTRYNIPYTAEHDVLRMNGFVFTVDEGRNYFISHPDLKALYDDDGMSAEVPIEIYADEVVLACAEHDWPLPRMTSTNGITAQMFALLGSIYQNNDDLSETICINSTNGNDD